MIETILTKLAGWANNIKLTLAQWAYVSLAGVIGLLLVRLKLQGSRLHRAQVALLGANMMMYVGKSDDAVNANRQAFLVAVKAYQDARRGL